MIVLSKEWLWLNKTTGKKKNKNEGACKYYISTLGGGMGSEGNAYFAYVARGGSTGKMLM